MVPFVLVSEKLNRQDADGVGVAVAGNRDTHATRRDHRGRIHIIHFSHRYDHMKIQRRSLRICTGRAPSASKVRNMSTTEPRQLATANSVRGSAMSKMNWSPRTTRVRSNESHVYPVEMSTKFTTTLPSSFRQSDRRQSVGKTKQKGQRKRFDRVAEREEYVQWLNGQFSLDIGQNKRGLTHRPFREPSTSIPDFSKRRKTSSRFSVV